MGKALDGKGAGWERRWMGKALDGKGAGWERRWMGKTLEAEREKRGWEKRWRLEDLKRPASSFHPPSAFTGLSLVLSF